MVRLAKKLWRDDEAPTSVEYGLMVAFIAIVIVGAVTALGVTVQGSFNAVMAGFP